MNETFNEAAPTLKFGTVSAVDEQTMRVRVRLPDLDNLRTDWLEVLRFEPSVAQRYMRVAKKLSNAATSPHLLKARALWQRG